MRSKVKSCRKKGYRKSQSLLFRIGKQWPLSCYGPFRDKPSVPNFIVDQSFEEVRALCYESKNQGNFQTVAAQFNQQVIDAKARISMLHDFNGDAQTIIVNLRGIGDDVDTVQTNTLISSTNPFSINASNIANNNQNTANIFGTASAATTNVFAPSGSVFGNNDKGFAGTTTGGLFNSGQSFISGNTPGGGGSLFGGGGGGFGSTLNSFSQSTAGTFGINKPAEQTGSNIFGMGQTQNNPIFGGSASFGNKTSNIFGQQPQQTDNSSNIFGQSQLTFGADATQSQPNIFGTNTIATNQNIFGSSIVGVGGPDNSSINNQQSVFGVTQGNIFGNQQSPIIPNVFGVEAQKTNFAAIVPTTSTQQTANPFSNTNATQPVNNAFGSFGFQNDAMQPPPAFPSATIQSQQLTFGDQQTTNVFQTQQNDSTQQLAASALLPNSNTVPAKIISESTIYSKIDNLTKDEIDCFKSNSFELGKIPTVPPPREFCL